MVWRNGEPIQVEDSNNQQLGEKGQSNFQEKSLSLRPGDLLVLHTDGIDALLKKVGTPFDILIRGLEKKDHLLSPLEIQNKVLALIESYLKTHPLPDDLTLLQFSINEKALYLHSTRV